MSDYIDRQATIDALDALCDRECEYSKQQRGFMCGACRLGSAFDVIDELPSVQPQRMKGKWKQADKNEPYFVQCSVCRYMTDNESDFCPNCGADMRGEDV